MPSQLDLDNQSTNRHSEQEIAKSQNSYRLESSNPFKIDPVDLIVKTIMITRLESIIYDSEESIRLCASIATDIREKIKELKFDRYKIVVNVTIIEKTGQSIESSLGFLWDAERDNYSTFIHETRTFYACCCVFGSYYE